MGKSYNYAGLLKTFILTGIILFAAHLASAQQQQVVSLYVSTQSGQTTTYSGTYSKTTDKFGSGNVTFSSTGPITYNITPNTFSIGPNETKTWNGTVAPSIQGAPQAGTSVAASITANYNIQYSRPYGTGTNGTVLSTYCCSNNGSMSGAGGCAFHNHQPGMHEIVKDSGSQSVLFNVVSILVNIPDTVCLGKTGQNNVMAMCYPAQGGTFSWTSNNPNVVITNGNTQNPNIKLLDTTIKNAVVTVSYSIGNVTYTSSGVLSCCECSCRPVTAGITAGPLQLNFNAPPVSSMPDGQGNCNYVAQNASFSLSLLGVINRSVQIPGNATVTFGKNCQAGTMTNVRVDWNGSINMSGLIVGNVPIFSMAVTAIHLQVATNGNLSGSVSVLVTNTADRDLSAGAGFVMLRKGTNSTITFTFNNTNTFNGAWNFSGIQGINIDLVKKNATGGNVNLANFTGNMTNAGVLTGTFTATAQPSYVTNLFTVTLLQLSLGLRMDIPNTSFSLTSGSGQVRISNMTAVTGTVDLGLNFPGNGNCIATVGASNITAFSMTLSQLNLTANFNSNFDLTRIQGSLKAKHNLFSAEINVSNFVIDSGSLQTFSASGRVKYSGFEFNLQNSNYVRNPGQLSISARVEINAAGTNAMVQVSAFNISNVGAITVGTVSGSFNRSPASFSFSAAFAQSRFTGSFSGSFASIGLDGSCDIGAMQNPDYDFAYLSITAKTNVPLGQSGLKLTRVGGQIGFNYQLNFPPPANGGGGNGQPQQGNYLAGLTLGVSDIANLCQVTGTAIVQFNAYTGNTVITLNGSIDVLASATFFTGNMNVNYRIPQQIVDGSVGATVKVPSSGFLITANNVNVAFSIGNGVWSARGNNMSGQIFNGIVQLSGGNINMGGSLSSPTSMTGTLGGNATAGFSYGVSIGSSSNNISGNVSLNLNSNINANINQAGLSGSFGVNVDGNGTLTLNTWLGSQSLSCGANANGNIGYNGGTLSLSGNVTITFPFYVPFIGNSVTQGFSISI